MNLKSFRSTFLLLVIGLLIFSALSINGQSDHARKSQQQPPQPGKRGVGSTIDDPSTQKQKQDKQDKDDITLNSDLVTVVAAVTGKDGNFVGDLKKEDFEIVEDNVPQTLTGFNREDAIPLDVAFLFDTSGSVRERRDFEKKAASNFFREVFRPQDHASIYLVNTEVERELPLTN